MFPGFELEHTELETRERLQQGNIVLSHEVVNRMELEEAAHYLIDNREAIAEIPIEDEHLHNAITGLFEKITASGHLSHIEFDGDQEQVHVATLQRLLNGHGLNKPEWEKRRNFEEICEELFVYRAFQQIKNGEIPKNTIILTSSDAPDEKVTDKEKVDQGYRMLNHKGMVRSYYFEEDTDGNWTRVLEQVSRSNSNDKSTQRWFNGNAAAVPLSSTGGLSMQALATTDRLKDGVVTWTEELDSIYGADRFCGETSNDSTREKYDNLRVESAKQELVLSKHTGNLAKVDAVLKTRQLAGEITYDERLADFYGYIDIELIPRIMLNAPKYARDTYGEEGGAYVEQAAYHFQQGNYEQARVFMLLGEVHRLEGASVGCGGAGASNERDGQGGIDDMINSAIAGAIEDKESWTWTEGICQVESCDTRPGMTKVGPCSVCKNCQHVFDNGGDPTKNIANTERNSISDLLLRIYIKKEKITDEQSAIAA